VTLRLRAGFPSRAFQYLARAATAARIVGIDAEQHDIILAHDVGLPALAVAGAIDTDMPDTSWS